MAFTEIAVDTTSAMEVERVLTAARVLAHRTAPLQARAPVVAAPDGTAVFFGRTGDGRAAPGSSRQVGWRDDFLATTPPPAGPATGITHIDHIGLAQPFDHFDEALLFYRSVLGLHLQGDQQLAAPYGLVRSRALASADRSVRIALSVALLGRGGSLRDAPEPQQIAFRMPGRVRGVRCACARRAARCCRSPDNYYADLEARTGLPADEVTRLRSHQVLFDRVDGRTFLHCYTPLIGNRLFVEVVQRQEGYDGYGAANTPVRMAALRSGSRS